MHTLRLALALVLAVAGPASAQVPLGRDPRDVALVVESQEWVRVTGRSWVLPPEPSDRCARASILRERVTRRAQRVLGWHLPPFHGRPTGARIVRWAMAPLRRWLERVVTQLSALKSDVARVHAEGCASESVEALAVLAGAYHHVLDEVDRIPVPEDIVGQVPGCLPRYRAFEPLYEIARAADEACLALAVAEGAFVPAARTCAARLASDDPGHYALDEMLPMRSWSPGVPPSPAISLGERIENFGGLDLSRREKSGTSGPTYPFGSQIGGVLTGPRRSAAARP